MATNKKVLDRMRAFLDRKRQQGAFRQTKSLHHLVDFSSNDYLGLARNVSLRNKALEAAKDWPTGATASRLLSGHYTLTEELEEYLADFHQGETALLFNSGYTANLSLLSTIPRRGDVLLYDDLVHASIHDGMRLSVSSQYPFAHNQPHHLESLLKQHQDKQIFVLIESLYSMDGDQAPLVEFHKLCEKYGAHLIVDEAHSTGVYGEYGEGLCVARGIADDVFARIHTFGKAIGTHGAVVIGSPLLKDYLVNFARPLIYTTAMSPHTTLATLHHYQHLRQHGHHLIEQLEERIVCFQKQLKASTTYQPTGSAIQSVLVPGNDAVVAAADTLQDKGFDVRAIRRPTVAAGQERLRICLHCHNSLEEIEQLVAAIQDIS